MQKDNLDQGGRRGGGGGAICQKAQTEFSTNIFNLFWSSVKIRFGDMIGRLKQLPFTQKKRYLLKLLSGYFMG